MMNSLCSGDVAYAVQWVFANCNVNDQVGGAYKVCHDLFMPLKVGICRILRCFRERLFDCRRREYRLVISSWVPSLVGAKTINGQLYITKWHKIDLSPVTPAVVICRFLVRASRYYGSTMYTQYLADLPQSLSEEEEPRHNSTSSS